MSWRPKLNVVCGRCGKPRGLAHVCVSNSRRKPTLKPQLSFGKCPDCKRPYGSNPLAHVCAPRSDFKARKTRFEKEQRARARKKRQQERHDYTECSDNECKRALCVAFKTGWKLGDQAGYERGFPDGIAACPENTSKETHVTQVLLILGLAAGYAVFLLISPTKTCQSCRGWGAKGRRRSACHRCHGTGRRFRLGARLVHRGAAEGYRYTRNRKEGQPCEASGTRQTATPPAAAWSWPSSAP